MFSIRPRWTRAVVTCASLLGLILLGAATPAVGADVVRHDVDELQVSVRFAEQLGGDPCLEHTLFLLFGTGLADEATVQYVHRVLDGCTRQPLANAEGFATADVLTVAPSLARARLVVTVPLASAFPGAVGVPDLPATVDLDLTVRGTGPVARQIGHSDEIRPDGVRVVTRTLHKQRTGTLVSGTPDVFVTPDVVPDVELVRRTTTTIEVRP